MFIDRVEIEIRAGNGGNGHTSFHRDKNTQKGGPNGGDGGRGGDIVFVGTTRLDNLIDFRFTKKFAAGDGVNGRPGNKNGKGGDDLEIALPLGTKIYKSDGELIADITTEHQRFIALKGGQGGRGNTHFATSRRQTPNFSHDGVATKAYNVTLELESIADVGIIGFPNVGKSTLLSIITRAHPKIANYQFTTLHPNIAVHRANGQNIILADIPGLIEGASEGKGLGHKFLKHISRTRMLIHMVDISEADGRNAMQDLDAINRELGAFSPELLNKPQIIVLNKIDAADPARVEEFKTSTKGDKVFLVSCATREGIEELMKHVAAEVAKLPRPKLTEPTAVLEEIIDKNQFHVQYVDGVFHVLGPMIDNLIRGVVLSDTESAAYFHRRLEKSGAIAALRDAGMQQGDTVQVASTQFIWED